MKVAYDIVVLVDVSESMSSALPHIVNHVNRFISDLESARLDWRCRIISYGGRMIDDAWRHLNSFVNEKKLVGDRLGELLNLTGNSGSYGLLDALYKVATWGNTDKGAQEIDAKKWRYRSDAIRCVIVFTDASFCDKTTLAEAPGLTWEDVANLVMQERLRISLFAPHMDCYDNLSQIDHCVYHAIPYDHGLTDGCQIAVRNFLRENDVVGLLHESLTQKKQPNTCYVAWLYQDLALAKERGDEEEVMRIEALLTRLGVTHDNL